MKKKIIILVLGAVFLWLLLHRTTEPPGNDSRESQVTLTNEKVVTLAQSRSAKSQTPSAPNAQTIPPLLSETERSNAIQQEMRADWQKPIEFYGKVVDENSNAIAGASVRFRWATITEDPKLTAATTESDFEGLFSLHGKLGRSLTVLVSKDGYYASGGGRKSFLYSLANDIHSPDPMNPVIFALKKKGAGEPLVVVRQNYRIPRDGTAAGINLTTGKMAIGETGDIVVQCRTEDQGKKSGEKYDWRCRITVPGGGVVLSNEEFNFMAQENGYNPFIEIAMPADRADWRSDASLKLFYRLSDGRYGRMTFSMIAGGQHFCTLESFLNPSAGSRNLEFDEAIQPPKPANYE